jgi:hypothetical protein
MRAMTIVIPLVLFVSEAALSQDRSKTLPGQTPAPTAPPSGGTAIPQAPVGHRQPMQSDLPAAARKEEDTAGRKPDPLGPIPNICKNC